MNHSEKQQEVSLETAETLGLLPEEYEKIIEILGRTPNFTELSMYSVMWSEHCSYKNSILWLKKLPNRGAHLLAGAGEENAGLVDIGDGLACAFKIESHNHPSAIEPYQGAATGVGGIHRDIFTMGARPIAALNSLRFGDLSSKQTRHLLQGVVRGIGNYGNSFGVPTVAGEIYFDPSYEVNPLVNAMSVGIVRHGDVVSAISKGVGNPVYIAGAATGKDGIHGATFASEDISEDSAEKLPSVQVGDPFQEKLLLEASLEAIATGAVVGMQDMGAAGITCSTSEMSEKGGCGMRIHLDRVPVRQEDMKAFEMLLSESQERMLIVVEKGREKEVEQVFEKWDIQYAVIGEVTEGNTLEYFMGEECVATVPADSLVLGGGAPVYEREYEEAPYFAKGQALDLSAIPDPGCYLEIAEKLVKSPNIASKRWIYEQYDSMVQIGNTSSNAPSDAAVIRIPGTEKGLAVTVDCNARYVRNDPFKGTMIAVSEAARNIVCSGAEPSAITNCLNFGNPYNKHVYWQFVNAIKGMREACLKFNTPVTGGNVSFYNQNAQGGPVFPTPTIGMVGTIREPAAHMTLHFKAEEDSIYLIGPLSDDFHSSEYLASWHGIDLSRAPEFDLETEARLHRAVLQIFGKELIRSAHDLSEGGLFVALLESAMAGGMGFAIDCPQGFRKDGFLFGEAQSRVLVSVAPDRCEAFEAEMEALGSPFHKLGKTGGTSLRIDGENWGSLKNWKKKYDERIARAMD